MKSDISLNTNKIKARSSKDMSNILNYYRLRMDEFEKERYHWIAKLESLRESMLDHHKLQWENKTKSDEINLLQIAITELKSELNKLSIEKIQFKEERDISRSMI